MTSDDIQALAAHLEAVGLAGCELQSGRATLRLWVESAPRAEDVGAHPIASTPEQSSVPGTVIRAPQAGIFRSQHPLLPHPAPTAACGQIIGYLQMDQMLSAVVTPCAGNATPLAMDGTVVGFGEPLFRIA